MNILVTFFIGYLFINMAMANSQTITFGVVGDTPYKPQDEILLVDSINSINKEYDNYDFIIHVGDIKSGAGSCINTKPTSAEKVADYLKKSIRPSFILIGDNEWNDCVNNKGEVQSPQAWAEWFETFNGYTQKNWPEVRKSHWGIKWQKNSLTINNIDYSMPNFSFIRKGILFIGLNIPKNSGAFDLQSKHDEIIERHIAQSAAKWAHESLTKNKDNVSAAVVFAHSSITGGDDAAYNYEDIILGDGGRPGFSGGAKAFAKPILYVQGDTHRWKITENYLKEKFNTPTTNITNLVVDSAIFSSITVDPSSSTPFSFVRNINTVDN